MNPEFYKDLKTGQVWEYTDKLAKVAAQRGLIPYTPVAATIEETEVEKLTKVQLGVQAGHLGKVLKRKVRLDMRKNLETLRKEISVLREEARVIKESE